MVKGKFSNEDWICEYPQCGNVNFAKRDTCNRCKKPRLQNSDSGKDSSLMLGTEIGKEAAEKSKGLYSADDWSCKSCGNVNWARRVRCNICDQPKFKKVEERTGYGGGYFERDDVNYKERGDSDNEFDDFGMKKKRFRSSTAQKSPSPEKSSDSEDVDLSKYMLDDEESGSYDL